MTPEEFKIVIGVITHEREAGNLLKTRMPEHYDQDDTILRFEQGWILIIPGNGRDVLSDWSSNINESVSKYLDSLENPDAIKLSPGKGGMKGSDQEQTEFRMGHG